ncbi:MAG: putative porin [Chitinophagales bacterium]|nr:putative porin [Chitinophagales bacterium]MDW8394264.1 putative porin [Chitinophagales bacterium]
MNLRRLNSRLLRSLWLLSVAVAPYAGAQDTVFRYYPQLTQYVVLDSPSRWQVLDTLPGSLHRYHPAEAAFSAMHLGYLGAPARYNRPDTDTDWGVRTGFTAYDLYHLPDGQLRFYNTRQPFTALGYQQGSRQELVIRILHTQNILPRLNAAFSYLRRRTDGGYQRQITRLSDGHLTLHYRDSVGFYEAFAAAVLHQVNAELNGGVLSDSVFEDQSLFNKKLAPVALHAATERNNEKSVHIVNAIKPGHVLRPNDSLQIANAAAWRLEHRLEWNGYRRFFNDDVLDSSAYVFPMPDKGITDSFTTSRITNRLLIRYQPAVGNRHAVLQFMQENWSIRNGAAAYSLGNFSVQAQVNSNLGRHLGCSATGYATLAGRNSGDYLVQPRVWIHWPYQQLGAEAAWLRQSPSLVAKQYVSDLFSYEQNLPARTMMRFRGWWQHHTWRTQLWVAWLRMNDAVYWSQTGAPNFGGLSGWQISARQLVIVFPMHLELEGLAQLYDSDSAFSFPTWIGRLSLFYQDRMFSGAGVVRIGTDVRYTSVYYQPAFLPVMGQFAEQRLLRNETHPEVDVFLNVYIRGVRAFVLVQQALQGIWGNGNYYGYRYPAADRSFKLGVEWWFWN